MTITIGLNDAQASAVAMLGIDVNELAVSAVGSTIKGKLNYYRNGATVKTAEESTHSVVKVKKDGTKKTIYYKGGLKEGAVKAYQMAKQFLPKDVTETVFVANALAEVDAVITALDGGVEEENENE